MRAAFVAAAVGLLVVAAVLVGTAAGTFSDQAQVGGNTLSTGSWVTLNPDGDTYLKSGTPNNNQGGELFLRVQQSGSNRALVQFDPVEMSNAAVGKTLHKAALRLYIQDNGNNWGGSGRTVDVHRLTTAWTEFGATWNCPDDTNTGNSQPDCPAQWDGGAFAGSPTDSVLHTNGLLGWVEWDVTADVSAMLAAPEANHGWIVKKTEEGQTGRVDYTSREGGANGPQLFLAFVN